MTDTPPPTDQQPLEDKVGKLFTGLLCWGAMADVGGSLGANPAMPTAAPGMGAGLLNMVGGAQSVFGTFMGLEAMSSMVGGLSSLADDQKNNPQFNRAPKAP
jgi:hypothetical protein